MLKLIEQLDSVEKQIAKLEADTDHTLSVELRRQMIDKLKKTQVEIAKMMVAGSDKSPIELL
jgi:hypothetical protein